MRKTVTTLAAASALVFVLAACGDDSGSGSGSGSTDESTSTDQPVSLEEPLNNEGVVDIGDDTTVDMEADDFYFDPTFTKAVAGAEVQVSIENEGDTAHTFTIDDQNVDVEVEPGDSAEATVTLPDGDALRYYCRFHESQGMQGAFYSQDGQTVIGVSGGASSPDTSSTTTGGSPGGYGY